MKNARRKQNADVYFALGSIATILILMWQLNVHDIALTYKLYIKLVVFTHLTGVLCTMSWARY